MEPRNLPIKFFSKRGTQDERRTEGGGDGSLPAWVLPTASLQAKSIEFQDSLSSTKTLLIERKPSRRFIPAVVEVSVREEAMAKSYRSEIVKLFDRKEEYNLIGISDDLNFMTKVDSIEHLNFITHNIERPSLFPIGISAIDEIKPFKPRIELPEDDSSPLKAKLIDFSDRSINKRVEAEFEQTLRDNEITYKKTAYTFGLTVFKLEHVQPDALASVQSFEGLYSIDPMPSFEVTLDDISSSDALPVKIPQEGSEYFTIGVLDSGISSIDHLRPWLDSRSYSAYVEDEIDRSHGTFVAGVLLYGDELEESNWVGKSEFKLLDATVFPKKGIRIDEDELIDNIRNAIQLFPDIKLWNLSGGGSTECGTRDFSDFAKALDELQLVHDIVICKSAGNCYNFVSSLPKMRIPNSADSVRSLVVGSIAHAQQAHDLVPKGYPSPFSRTGFGPNKIIKPDITHYGGNAGLSSSRRILYTGVRSFSVSGGIIQHSGTSFSTPRVSSLLANLHQQIDGEFDPLLLKALAIHSAKYDASITLTPQERLKEMGFGLPSPASEIIFNAPYESTLILQDNIVRGGYIEILDFPFPEILANDQGQYYGEIILTLVYNPRLDGTQGAEYCQSNIDVSFGTYDRIKLRDTNVQTIINPLGKENPYNLLLPAHYAAKFRRYNDHPFTVERQLRDDLGKFHPVKKYAINIQEMTEANRVRGLTAPKKWYLKLNGLFSHAAENAAAVDGEVLSQDFCLIITIRDPLKQHDVYNVVTRNLTLNNFQHSNIQLRNEVNVRNG